MELRDINGGYKPEDTYQVCTFEMRLPHEVTAPTKKAQYNRAKKRNRLKRRKYHEHDDLKQCFKCSMHRFEPLEPVEQVLNMCAEARKHSIVLVTVTCQ